MQWDGFWAWVCVTPALKELIAQQMTCLWKWLKTAPVKSGWSLGPSQQLEAATYKL